MDGLPAFVDHNPEDSEESRSDLLQNHRRIAQPHDRPPITPSDNNSIDTSIDHTRLPEPLLTTPTDIQTSTMRATRQTRNRLTAPKSESIKLASPGFSDGSSATPETQSSQQTTTPEDTPANTNGNPLHTAVDGSPPLDGPPTKRRRQRKKPAEYNVHIMDVGKRNKFLERNRMAATKCRQKKKEWVSDLEEARFGLESQHNHLQMEFSSLRNEITQIKSQLMEHANCSDPNINKWIENEAKKFVLGAGNRYDHMLANLGSGPGTMVRDGSFPSAPGYPTGPDSELLSPMTPSQRGSISFPNGTMGPSSPVFYRPDLASNGPDATLISIEETYPSNLMTSSMAEDANGFGGVSIVDDTFEDAAVIGS